MDKHVYTARTWAEARKILQGLRPGMPISFGTGNPISYPYVQAAQLDADAGEGIGYRVTIRRRGDGYMNPAEHYLIYVGNSQPECLKPQPCLDAAIKTPSRFVVSESRSHYLAGTTFDADPAPDSVLASKLAGLMLLPAHDCPLALC